MKKASLLLVVAVTFALLGASSLYAAAIVPGFGTSVGGRNDDGGFPCASGSSGAGCAGVIQPIGFSINFFGSNYSNLFINNNGNLTFSSWLPTFTPFGLTGPLGQAIIAPFFADVDTRFAGNPVAIGYGSVSGYTAFGATWDEVDYYYSSGVHTLSNSFQVLLVDRSDVNPGDFDIEFNYDRIQWETGDASGGAGGLGGFSARVGFSNGTGTAGTFYEMVGSGVNGAFLDGNITTGLINNEFNSTELGQTASPLDGRYIFMVRNGIPVVPAPEPSALVLMGLGLALVGGKLLREGAKRG